MTYISLSQEQEDQIARRVLSGRYASASDVVVCALQLLDTVEQVQESHAVLSEEPRPGGFLDIDFGDTQVFEKDEMEKLKASCRQARRVTDDPEEPLV